MIYVFLFIQAIICAALSGNIAEKKGYSLGNWAAVGFFFGILGLIVAVGLPMKSDLNFTNKTCPSCAEKIRLEAKICRYCGQKFNKKDIIKEIEKALYNSEESRFHAIEILSTMHDEIAIPYLEEVLNNELDSKAFDLAVQGLFEIGTTSALIVLLNYGDYKIKRKAMLLLHEIDDESVTPIFVTALQDDDINDIAKSILVKIGTSAIPHLEKIGNETEPIKNITDKIITKIRAKS